MIPDSFASELKEHAEFQGEISMDLASRVVYSTDNSLFEILPQGIIFPRSEKDLSIILHLIAQERYRSISLIPRGGGTSTNGQSLGHGFVIDTAKYMNQIIEFNPESQTVRCEAGVILDQLNRRLSNDGYMFAPTTSSSSRVTLGGMISTDASGIGSMVWGKTSDHILGLRIVLWGGQILSLSNKTIASLKSLLREIKGPVSLKHLPDLLLKAQEDYQEKIPQLPRFFSGYNLRCFSEEKTLCDLTRLIAGSEGSLGMISSCTLQIVPKAKKETLFVCVFNSMDSCLGASSSFWPFSPTATELLDEHILAVAPSDIHWDATLLAKKLKDLDLKGYGSSLCALFISFKDHFQGHYDETLQKFHTHLQDMERNPEYGMLTYVFSDEKNKIQALWNIRKKAVGLFAYSSRSGDSESKKSSAFIEDCAVHPSKVAPFIKDLRKLLDSHHLNYGIYGHLDAGCVHVRPQLDYQDPSLAKTIRTISDKTYQLTQQYGGVLWGEHGKGFRSEYLQDFLGEALYRTFCQIKQLFDPFHQLNPGKIVPPLSMIPTPSPTVTELPLRAYKEQALDPQLKNLFRGATSCDGNGVCFQEDAEQVMCPSYLATRSRIHSPKGRAQLIREWMHQKSQNQLSRQFSRQVFEALEGCLMCKGCTKGCPVQVDIPTLKSQFLHLYHQTHPRRFRDYLLGYAESHLPWIATFRLLRYLYNRIMLNTHIRSLLEKIASMSDFPSLKPAFSHTLSSSSKDVDVVLIPDLISYTLEPDLLQHFVQLLSQIKLNVYLSPYRPSGKSWHSLGFIKKFHKTAQHHQQHLQRLSQRFPQAIMVGIDPGLSLIFRQEYRSLSSGSPLDVLLPQEFLHSLDSSFLLTLKKKLQHVSKNSEHRAYLFLHCFESSTVPQASSLWIEFFSKLDLKVEAIKVGCCGLAGFWGQKKENVKMSKEIFMLFWLPSLEKILLSQKPREKTILLVTGGSCRQQISRFMPPHLRSYPYKVLHPLEYLANFQEEAKVSTLSNDEHTS